MNKKITVNSDTYKILYVKYKDYLISCLIIFICFLLIVLVVIPQIQSLSEINKEERETRQRIEIIQRNQRFLSELQPDDIDKTLHSLSNALPSQKDFAGILYALALASSRSNTVMQDYSFDVGEISSSSAEMDQKPALPVVVTIQGGIEGTREFIEAISQIIPLSDVTNVDVNENSASLTIDFYFKAFSPVTFNNSVAIPVLTEEDLNMIKIITSYVDSKAGNNSIDTFKSAPSATISAQTVSGGTASGSGDLTL